MKKGIIFTVIILIVAAVLTVVFVTLFKERDTDAVANKVISVVDEGYLSENSDKEFSSVIVVCLSNKSELL